VRYPEPPGALPDRIALAPELTDDPLKDESGRTHWAVVMRQLGESLRDRPPIRAGEEYVAMGDVNPDESLEIGPGVFKRLADCTGSEIESAIRLIARKRIDRAWIDERAAGPDQGELTIGRRFFAKTTAAERDLIAYWQMVKLVEEERLRLTKGRDA
jgi:hypothetical protein